MTFLWPAPWIVGLALVAALGLGMLAYRARHPWPRAWRWTFALVRGTLAGVIVLLLGGLACERTRTDTTPPLVVVAVDDSRSMTQGADAAALRRALTPVIERLTEAGLAVRVTGLSGPLPSLDSLRLMAPSTDLSALLGQSQSFFLDGQLRAVMMVSDGRHNQGPAPSAGMLSGDVSLYTLVVGDTLAKPDHAIVRTQAPRLVGAGSRYPVRVLVSSRGMGSAPVRLTLDRGGRRLAERTLRPLPGGAAQAVEILVEAGGPGLETLEINVAPGPGERLLDNNRAQVYVRVEDLKTRVLIAAAAPHPDIKALRAALDGQLGTEVVVWVAGQGPVPEGPWQVAILHRLPDGAIGMPEGLEARLGPQTARWYIAAQGTALPALSAQNGVITLPGPMTGQSEEVMPGVNEQFGRFQMEGIGQGIWARLPPLVAPYGAVTLQPGAEVILDQRIGAASTGKPLLVYRATPAGRRAVLLGEGLWVRRLQEMAARQGAGPSMAVGTGTGPLQTDLIIRRTVELLATRGGGGRLRAQPYQPILAEGQAPELDLRLDDPTGRPVYGAPVTLELRPAGGQSVPGGLTRPRTLQTSPSGRVLLEPLPAGPYTYTARATQAGQTLTDRGQINIEAFQPELTADGADVGLMRNLARTGRGVSRPLAAAGELTDSLLARPLPPALRTQSTREPLARLPWVWALVLSAFVAELAARRLKGGV